MEWSIRGLLNPVITRSLIFGVNPIDMEYVLKQMEKKPLINGKVLEETWNEEWSKKANRYSTYGKEAREQGNLLSASEFYMMTARCYYACYLINSDQIAGKREVYKKLERYYEASLGCSTKRFEKVSLKMKDTKVLPGYLHLPDPARFKAPYPCVMLFPGIGSCKEEVETKARPLVERGVAVLAMDIPGVGAALFDYDVKLGGAALEEAFELMMNYLTGHELIDETRLGSYGLCMGGGYSYHVAAKYKQIKCCANLFPLFITMLGQDATPRWMKQGVWAEYQREAGTIESFSEGMKVLEEGSVSCDYLVVHSNYDNWMPLEKTKVLLDKTTGKIDEVIISEQPVYATKESVMHAMPVGEQMHWVKIRVADWFVKHLNKESKDEK